MGRSDEDLMLACAAGEPTAFAELVRRRLPGLVRWLAARTVDREEALALARRTFVQLHRERRDFRRGMSVGIWLETIAMNLGGAASRPNRAG